MPVPVTAGCDTTQWQGPSDVTHWCHADSALAEQQNYTSERMIYLLFSAVSEYHISRITRGDKYMFFCSFDFWSYVICKHANSHAYNVTAAQSRIIQQCQTLPNEWLLSGISQWFHSNCRQLKHKQIYYLALIKNSFSGTWW